MVKRFLEGYASVKQQVDECGDLILEGAYGDLEKLKKSGFVTVSHDANSLPIGWIEEAKEDEFGLWVKMGFHSTPLAEQAFSVASERLDAGKEVGLSIGYLPKKWKFEMIDGRKVRVLQEIEVKEFSLVSLPAANGAIALDVWEDLGEPLIEEILLLEREALERGWIN